MFYELGRMADARQAPFHPHHFGKDRPEPFDISVWICAGCLKMAPAIGLQAECKPTDWTKHTVKVEPVDFSYLLCPECTRKAK